MLTAFAEAGAADLDAEAVLVDHVSVVTVIGDHGNGCAPLELAVG